MFLQLRLQFGGDGRQTASPSPVQISTNWGKEQLIPNVCQNNRAARLHFASMRYTRLPASFFSSNRDRLAALLPAGALAIISSNDPMPTNADGTMGFAQNSDLYYLSGVDQEETLLVLFPSSHDPKRRAMLFLRETSEEIAVWEGAKLTKEEAREATGIQNVFWLREMERPLREALAEAQSVYLGLNEHVRNGSEVETRERRFIEQMRRDHPLHELKRLAPLLIPLRMVKAPEEIEAVRQATRATVAGFERLLRFVRPGVQEFEIEAELAHEYLRRRSRVWSFSPIVASGKNATVLHYIENNATCQDGELLLLDCAAEYANYHSDMTRTIPVNGMFTPRQREVYEAVLRVLEFSKTQLKPGVLLKDVQKSVEKNMEDELIKLGLLTEEQRAKEDEEKPALKKFFPHGVSHHIGLDTHDVSLGWVPLAPNMILTVEPGIYIRDEGLGIRLENLIVIGEGENEDLMRGVPLAPDDIDAAMKRD